MSEGTVAGQPWVLAGIGGRRELSVRVGLGGRMDWGCYRPQDKDFGLRYRWSAYSNTAFPYGLTKRLILRPTIESRA